VNNTRNEAYLKAFGDHLRKLRKKQGMTMMELAFEADIEYSQVAKIERGLVNTTISTTLILAQSLKVKPPIYFSLPSLQNLTSRNASFFWYRQRHRNSRPTFANP